MITLARQGGQGQQGLRWGHRQAPEQTTQSRPSGRYWADRFGAVSALTESAVATLHLAMHNRSKHTLFTFAFVSPPSTMTILLTTFNAVWLVIIGIKIVSQKYLFKELIGGG